MSAQALVVAQMQSPAEREAIFTEMVADAARGEPLAMLRYLAEDIVLELPGGSAIAGRHVGIKGVAGFLSAIARSVRVAGKEIAFSHEGDELTARLSVLVEGEHATIEMRILFWITFGPDGLMHRAVLEPSEPATFDWLVENMAGGDG